MFPFSSFQGILSIPPCMAVLSYLQLIHVTHFLVKFVSSSPFLCADLVNYRTLVNCCTFKESSVCWSCELLYIQGVKCVLILWSIGLLRCSLCGSSQLMSSAQTWNLFLLCYLLLHPDTRLSYNRILIVVHHNTPWQHTNVITQPQTVSSWPWMCIEVLPDPHADSAGV